MNDEVREAAAEYLVESSAGETEEASDLRPLIRLLEHAEGFAVAFLQHDVPFAAERLVSNLLGELASRGRPGDILRLNQPTHDLLGTLEELDHPPGRPLFILGFERSIPADAVFPTALTRLNMARDFYRRLPFAIVLVLPRYALDKLARQAPDFWAWRSGVFEIEPSLKELRELIIAQPIGEVDLYRDLSTEAKRRYLDTVEILLDDYRRRDVNEGEDLALLYRRAAAILKAQGRHQQALDHLVRALEVAERSGNEELKTDLQLDLVQPTLYLGDMDEALRLVQVVVAARRRRAEDRDDALAAADLARSLVAYGWVLGERRQDEEALEVTLRATTIWRHLVNDFSPRYAPDLAESLLNCGVFQGRLGRYDESKETTREALEIYRQLVSETRGQYLSGLALTLSQAANVLGAEQRHQEAVRLRQEAVETWRRFAAASGVDVRGEMSQALSNLAVDLSLSGRVDEALEAANEAVLQQRELIAGEVEFWADSFALASRLNVLGTCLGLAGRFDEAADCLEEALSVLEALPLDELQAHQRDISFLVTQYRNFASMTTERTAGLPRFDRIREALEG